MGWLYDVAFMMSFVSLGSSLGSLITFVRLRERPRWVAGAVALSLLNLSCAAYWATRIVGG